MGNVTKKLGRRKAATNWPLFLLAGLAAVTVEGVTCALLWIGEPDHVIGVLFSILTGSFTLLGLVVSRAVGLFKADPRDGEFRKALGARVVSLLLILPSAVVGGGAMALKMEDRAAIEFATSEAYRASLANSKDMNLDSQVRAEETAKLERAIRPTQVRYDDGAFFLALFAYLAMLGLPTVAVGTGMVVAPETEGQRKRREAELRAAKARVTREKNKKERDRLARKGKSTPKLATNNGAWVAGLKP